MTYGDFQDLPRRTAFNKDLHDKVFNVVKIQNTMEINVDLYQWFIHFLIKSVLVLILQVVLLKGLFCQTND